MDSFPLIYILNVTLRQKINKHTWRFTLTTEKRLHGQSNNFINERGCVMWSTNSIFLASLLFSLLRNRSMPVFYGFKQSTLAKEGLTTNRTVPCLFAALWKLWRQSTWPTLAKQSPIINTMFKTGESRELARDYCAQRAAEWPSGFCWEYVSFL